MYDVLSAEIYAVNALDMLIHHLLFPIQSIVSNAAPELNVKAVIDKDTEALTTGEVSHRDIQLVFTRRYRTVPSDRAIVVEDTSVAEATANTGWTNLGRHYRC
ncbi:hypothetical protein D3C73_1483300 [compost metagenome]